MSLYDGRGSKVLLCIYPPLTTRVASRLQKSWEFVQPDSAPLLEELGFV